MAVLAWMFGVPIYLLIGFCLILGLVIIMSFAEIRRTNNMRPSPKREKRIGKEVERFRNNFFGGLFRNRPELTELELWWDKWGMYILTVIWPPVVLFLIANIIYDLVMSVFGY